MSVFLTSDLHLGHKLAAHLRGYASTAEHDEAVIQKLMQQTSKRDVLWILGDVAWKYEDLIRLKELACKDVRMVRGNHDTLSMEEYAEVFTHVHGFLRYKNMWLSHCPIHPQEMYRTKANVHGHIHKGAATQPLKFPYINVNWDFWGRAVELDELRSML